MKTQTIILSLLLLAGMSMGVAKAESTEVKEDSVVTSERQAPIDSHESEELINKIEAAQKEQMLKFVQKKHFSRDEDYI